MSRQPRSPGIARGWASFCPRSEGRLGADSENPSLRPISILWRPSLAAASPLELVSDARSAFYSLIRFADSEDHRDRDVRRGRDTKLVVARNRWFESSSLQR